LLFHEEFYGDTIIEDFYKDTVHELKSSEKKEKVGSKKNHPVE